MYLPENTKKLTLWTEEIIDRCMASSSSRALDAAQVRSWIYAGSPDGDTAILNRLYAHVRRTADMIYSPDDLRFNMDFEHHYEKDMLDKAEVASRTVTRLWQRRNIDIQFGEGIFLALQYGACIPKLMDTNQGVDARLVMPWQVGVYLDNREEFADQEAVNEKNYITPFELWRRISHLPEAPVLFKRAMSYAKKNAGSDSNYLHQVLISGSSPPIQTSAPFSTSPGGMVQVNPNTMGAATNSAQVQEELIELNELWVWDDEREDYTTIQMAAPDILIAPLYRRKNLFIPGYMPYGLIRPNSMAGNFWGRTEIADLMKLQALLRDRLEDVKKLMSLQYDRIMAYSGQSGLQDEEYDRMKQAGFIAVGQGEEIKDITPPLPKEWAEDIQIINRLMDDISGFQPIMSGEGEQGVRAGVHAQTLLRTASPRMRNRALIAERQCADFATTTFELLKAKQAKAYWTARGEDFLLGQLPEDYRITVDSHSSSPVYEQDHQQIAAFLAKLQVIDGESLLDLLPVPMRDILKARYRDMQEKKAQQAQQLMQHPELLKVIEGGKKKR